MALLAVSITSVGAFAQSAMTVFGVVDVGIQHTDTTGAQSLTREVSGSNLTSRIGFRGVEDLGGGMNTSFWLEASLLGDTGNGAGTGGALIFDRRSTLSLSSDWGELRMGRDFTPSYLNVSRVDVFLTNGIGSSRSLIGAGAVTAPTFARASKSVAYHLPSGMGGVFGQAMYATTANASNATNPDEGHYSGVRLGYGRQDWDVAAAWGDTKFLGRDFVNANIAATAKFGDFRLFALVNQSRLESPAVQKQRDYQLAASMVVGVGEIKASFIRSKVTPGATQNKSSLYAVGYVHNISKRTAAYMHYAAVDNEGAARYTNGPNAPLAGGSAKGYEFGLRHSF